jgi:hypothetical protein
MRLSLWQQFSSNHSGFYQIVGLFPSAEEAQQAAEELRRLFREVETWYLAQPDLPDDYLPPPDEISPPEQRWRVAHGLMLAGMSLFDFEMVNFDFEAAQVVKVWEQMIFLASGSTWHLPDDYGKLSRALGGQWAVEYDMGETISKVWIAVECKAASTADAAKIHQIVGAYLNSSNDFEMPPWVKLALPPIEVYSLKTIGAANFTGDKLQFSLNFMDVSRTLPRLVEYLKEHGCTDFQFQIRDESAYNYPPRDNPPSSEGSP